MKKASRRLQTSTNQKWIAGVLVVVLAAVGAWILIFAKAATPPQTPAEGAASTLSLSPASGTYTNGATFTVSLYEDSGSQQVNATDIGVVYDTGKLQYVSASTSSSTFSPAAPPSASGGIVVVTSYVNPGTVSGGYVTGRQLVATITFKVLAGSGSTALSFLNSASNPPRSAIYLYKVGTNIWDGQTAGGSYNLATEGSGGSGGGSGGGTGGGKGGTSSGSTGTKTTPHSSSSNRSTPSTGTSSPSSSTTGSEPASPLAPTDSNESSSNNSPIAATTTATSHKLPASIPMIVGAIIVVAGATTGYVLLRRRALNRLYGSSAHHQGVVFDAASVPKAPSQPVNNLETTVVKPTDKPDEPSPGPGPTNPA